VSKDENVLDGKKTYNRFFTLQTPPPIVHRLSLGSYSLTMVECYSIQKKLLIYDRLMVKNLPPLIYPNLGVVYSKSQNHTKPF